MDYQIGVTKCWQTIKCMCVYVLMADRCKFLKVDTDINYVRFQLLIANFMCQYLIPLNCENCMPKNYHMLEFLPINELSIDCYFFYEKHYWTIK